MQQEEGSEAILVAPARPGPGRQRAYWQRFRRVIAEAAFSPEWLPAPWNSPVVGYGVALLSPALTILLTWFLLRAFPQFALQGILSLLATLVVALLWGTGPGVLATLVGAVLLNIFVFHPAFARSISLFQPALETVMFLVTGGSISLVVGRIEYAREQAARERAYADAQARELEVILATIADSILVYDAQRHVRRVNPAAQAFNPYTRQDNYLTGAFPERFDSFQPRDEQGQPLSQEDLPAMRALRGEVLTGDLAADILLRTVDGEDRLYSISGAPIRDEAGDITGAVVAMRDVTERRRAAQRTRTALQALLQFAEALMEAGVAEASSTREDDEGVTGVDRVTTRLAALMGQVLGYEGVGITAFRMGTQPMSTGVYGLSPEQERGWQERRRGFTIQELVVGTSIERHLMAGEAVVIDPGVPPFSAHPTIYGLKNILLVPMYLEKQPVGVVTCIAGDEAHDYTEEEIALARALAQLAALTLERTRLFQERTQAEAVVLALRETNRLMDEFIGIAGHELRTPLTTIKGSVELARRQANKMLAHQERLPADMAALVVKMQSHLDRTERQIRMQNRLIGDLLDVARIHANRLELYPELCDLLVLVRESVEDQRYLTPGRTITLTGNASGEVLVMVDEDRVRQVVSNYLSNALKYSEADKAVEVRLDLVGEQARISVCDEGPGLHREQQQRIWERFYRVPDVVVKSGSGVGLGLGLHISRMIIERLGGSVGVESAPGKGSTFWLTLPLAQPDDSEM